MTIEDLVDLMIKKKGEMRRESSPFRISEMLQNIIYFFNQIPIRDYTIEQSQKLLPAGKNVDWDGTYYFDEQGKIDPYYHKGLSPGTTLSKFIAARPIFQKTNKKQQQKNYYILFTCCILYEDNRVHYLSFIYRPSTRSLVSFDPGIHLYTKGQDVLVPHIRESFLRAGLIPKTKNHLERIGLCKEKYFNRRWGIQYDGSDPAVTSLPADSFCQSWTLFFLIEFMRQGCTDRFFRSWCKVPPKSRETFILSHYFLPWLQQDPFIYKEFKQFFPQGDVHHLLDYITSDLKK